MTDDECSNFAAITHTCPPFVAAKPDKIVYMPANNRLYLANAGTDTISVIDLSIDKVVNRITTEPFSDGIIYVPSNNRLYVANARTDTISVIDPLTNKVNQIDNR